jgi:hypothetical protein
MILGMIRQLMMPLLKGVISAQSSQAPKIRIVFPEGHSEKASMTYGLHDPAKDDWDLFNSVSMQPGYSVLEIPAQTDRFKALVWAPGCQMKHFDVPVEKSDVELQFACTPLKTVPFQGRVLGIKGQESSRISVAYVSLETLFWFYDFKERVGSSAAPEISEIATTAASPGGGFKMQRPDLSADPIASRESWAFLEFRITDGKRYHKLSPHDSKGIGTGGRD